MRYALKDGSQRTRGVINVIQMPTDAHIEVSEMGLDLLYVMTQNCFLVIVIFEAPYNCGRA